MKMTLWLRLNEDTTLKIEKHMNHELDMQEFIDLCVDDLEEYSYSQEDFLSVKTETTQY